MPISQKRKNEPETDDEEDAPDERPSRKKLFAGKAKRCACLGSIDHVRCICSFPRHIT